MFLFAKPLLKSNKLSPHFIFLHEGDKKKKFEPYTCKTFLPLTLKKIKFA